MAVTINANNFTATLAQGPRGDTTNSIVLSGWSDAGAVITFPDLEPYANVREGLDGTAIGTRRRNTGGEVSFEFMSNSPSVKWFQDRFAELNNDEQVEVQGIVVNTATGETCTLADGLLLRGGAFPSFGTDGISAMTFVVRFTNISSNYTNFNPVVIQEEG